MVAAAADPRMMAMLVASRLELARRLALARWVEQAAVPAALVRDFWALQRELGRCWG